MRYSALGSSKAVSIVVSAVWIATTPRLCTGNDLLQIGTRLPDQFRANLRRLSDQHPRFACIPEWMPRSFCEQALHIGGFGNNIAQLGKHWKRQRTILERVSADGWKRAVGVAGVSPMLTIEYWKRPPEMLNQR